MKFLSCGLVLGLLAYGVVQAASVVAPVQRAQPAQQAPKKQKKPKPVPVAVAPAVIDDPNMLHIIRNICVDDPKMEMIKVGWACDTITDRGPQVVLAFCKANALTPAQCKEVAQYWYDLTPSVPADDPQGRKYRDYKNVILDAETTVRDLGLDFSKGQGIGDDVWLRGSDPETANTIWMSNVQTPALEYYTQCIKKEKSDTYCRSEVACKLRAKDATGAWCKKILNCNSTAQVKAQAAKPAAAASQQPAQAPARARVQPQARRSVGGANESPV